MVAKVRLLDDSVINKIAAGEVIERPASVLKELVENSVDAGATRITVEVEKGGRALMSVTDDGCGMSREDALMSLERHATSKIRSDADLFSIASLGFRGEAVPSIAAVSRFELITGEHGAEAGTRLVVEGGDVTVLEDAPSPGGTEIRVRRLFFNTPVRTRFLRSPRTEMAHVVDAVHRLSLAAPHVAFRLIADGRRLLDAPRAHTLEARVAAVLGSKTVASMVPLQAERDGVRLEGLVSKPSLSRANSGGLYLYVNGRFVKDRTLVGAVLSAYRGILGRGRYPIVVLFLDVPPDTVDVNVHPTKVEVRFVNSSEIWRFLGAAVSDRLSAVGSAPAEPRAGLDGADSEAGGEEAEGEEGDAPLPADGPPPGFGPAISRPPPRPFARTVASSALEAAPPGAETADPLGRAAAAAAPEAGPRPCRGSASAWAARPRDGDGWGGRSRPRFSDLRVLAQYDASFLLCELDGELMVLDQHAAHERVVFDRLRLLTPRPQRLLVPELLELGPDRTRALTEQAAAPLAELGIEISAFGDGTLALQGVPAGLAATRIRGALQDLADALATGPLDVGALRIDLAAMLACHGAVRAGDALVPAETRTLLAHLDRIDDAFACPHGRPTLARFDRADVARWFGGER